MLRRVRFVVVVVMTMFIGCSSRVPESYMTMCETDAACTPPLTCLEVNGTGRCSFACEEDTECPAQCLEHGVCDEAVCTPGEGCL